MWNIRMKLFIHKYVWCRLAVVVANWETTCYVLVCNLRWKKHTSLVPVNTCSWKFSTFIKFFLVVSFMLVCSNICIGPNYFWIILPHFVCVWLILQKSVSRTSINHNVQSSSKCPNQQTDEHRLNILNSTELY